MPYIHPRSREWLDWRSHIRDLTSSLRSLVDAVDAAAVLADTQDAAEEAAMVLNRERSDCEPEDVGELNYMLTTTIKEYVDRRTLSYGLINDVMGAVTGAANEFYRRVAAPYEDKKIKQNGDVY